MLIDYLKKKKIKKKVSHVDTLLFNYMEEKLFEEIRGEIDFD